MLKKLLLLMFLTAALWTLNVQAQESLPGMQPGWERIEPGGETICADGSPFSFYVHPGTSERLTIYLDGGGACWNEVMCDFGGIFDGSGLNIYVNQVLDYQTRDGQGMFDFENPENPFREDTIVYIPYCTGDVHAGSRTVTYDTSAGDLVIEHKGYINASAALDWTYENYPAPESVIVSGCSAGSVGTTLHAPYVFEQYPDIPRYQLNDSFVGVTNGPPTAFDVWGTYDHFAVWIPAVADLIGQFSTSAYIQSVAEYYPDTQFAHFTTAYDGVQTRFYGMLGLPLEEWEQGAVVLMQANNRAEDLQPEWSAAMFEVWENVDAPNLHRYIAPGAEHCLINRDLLYTMEVEGVRVVEWINDFINGRRVEDVVCTDCEVEAAE